MGDSDDENFVTFGSALEPLDEDNLPKKKPIAVEEQFALDAQGRRRFHGAFTGGFSAGYFNSVGTRDGWRPQQFKSSRASKAQGLTQNPGDFMDEEDTGDFGFAPTAIRANSDFTDHGKRGLKRERRRHDNNGPIPGVPVLQDLLRPVKDTVGVSLLKKMGWRPGQGIGPRVTKVEKARTRKTNEKLKIYGCSLPNQTENKDETDSDGSDDNSKEILFAPDDYEPFICNPKDNYFGIGYSGLDRRPVLSSHVNLFEPSTSFELRGNNKKLSIRGQAFGVGAFEADDEDIYQRDDMSRYDFALGPERKSEKTRWTKSTNDRSDSRNSCLEGFVPATKIHERKKVFEPPELPKDFKPVHVVRKSRFYPPIEPIRIDDNARKKNPSVNLSANDRAKILGEKSDVEPRCVPNSEQNVNESKSKSVACNIISRALNLHGREQVEERKLQEEARAKSASWLDKLKYQSFVLGGVEGGVDSEKSGGLEATENLRKEKIVSSSTKKAFFFDDDKQFRFDKFLELSKAGEKSKLASLQPLSMTEWEREREKDEFEQMLKIWENSRSEETVENLEVEKLWKNQRPSDSTMSGRFVEAAGESAKQTAENSLSKSLEEQMKDATKMKLFGKLTRHREIWQPASIVCKRFNIPEPRSGCPRPEKTSKKNKFTIFDSLEFIGDSGRSQDVLEIPESLKITRAPHENSINEVSGALSLCDDPAGLGTSEKMKNFAVSYDKVFGNNASITTTPGERKEKEDEEKARENSNCEKTAMETINSAEKKDLFKSIFLSSSENSEEENSAEEDDKDDEEAVKSLLIGKPSREMNIERNTSPPRGIFANLDLDSLVKSSKLSADTKLSMDLKKDDNDNENNDKMNDKDSKIAEKSSSLPEVEMPDMYGPALPATMVRGSGTSASEAASSSKDLEFNRTAVFKSVVVTKNSENSPRSKEKWVERAKVKKSKKDKHKHKHREKERSKHKHKSKKSKH